MALPHGLHDYRLLESEEMKKRGNKPLTTSEDGGNIREINRGGMKMSENTRALTKYGVLKIIEDVFGSFLDKLRVLREEDNNTIYLDELVEAVDGVHDEIITDRINARYSE